MATQRSARVFAIYDLMVGLDSVFAHKLLREVIARLPTARGVAVPPRPTIAREATP